VKSYISHLECTACQKTYSSDDPHRTCQDCGKVLYARYDLAAARNAVDKYAIASRPATMWRYYEVMPVRDQDNVVTLGEGMTPLIHARNLGAQLGCPNLYIKDEGGNPTGSFKARGISAAVSKAKELGLSKLTMPSAGNAAGALAAYCARGGIVDESALVEALQSGQVGGAAIDVFETEPPGEHPLLANPRVLATPHLGASTEEAQESVAIEAADILATFLLRGEVRHAVNMAPISTFIRLKNFLKITAKSICMLIKKKY